MTNYEKYKDDIIKTLFTKGGIGIDKKTGELRSCCMLDYCKNCQFNGDCRSDTIRKWLDSEYVEPEKGEVDWSKVPIDTKVLVSNDGVTWYKRYFAGVLCETGCPQVFANGADNWSNSLTESWKYVKLAEDK